MPAAKSSRPPAAAPASRTAGPWELWPWSLAALVPEAAQAGQRRGAGDDRLALPARHLTNRLRPGRGRAPGTAEARPGGGVAPSAGARIRRGPRRTAGTAVTGRDIARIRRVRTRSISPENPTGAPGQGGRATEGTGAAAARELGPGWKVSPSIEIEPGTTIDLAVIDGPGRITHIWLTTHPDHWRSLLLRAHWDGDPKPAVEVPVGDFFGQGWGRFAQLSSSMIAVNPHGGLNSYWPMPFRAAARLTLENLAPARPIVYYQVTYELGRATTERSGYLHAQWRRSNPLAAGGAHAARRRARHRPVRRHLPRVGSQLARLVGRGRDQVLPRRRRRSSPPSAAPAPRTTSAGPGTSTSRARATPPTPRPTSACTRSSGRTGCTRASSASACTAGTCPTRSTSRPAIRVDIQALGWRSGGRYLPRHDDIASTALFYLDAPSATPPPTPGPDELEVL